MFSFSIFIFRFTSAAKETTHLLALLLGLEALDEMEVVGRNGRHDPALYKKRPTLYKEITRGGFSRRFGLVMK